MHQISCTSKHTYNEVIPCFNALRLIWHHAHFTVGLCKFDIQRQMVNQPYTILYHDCFNWTPLHNTIRSNNVYYKTLIVNHRKGIENKYNILSGISNSFSPEITTFIVLQEVLWPTLVNYYLNPLLYAFRVAFVPR